MFLTQAVIHEIQRVANTLPLSVYHRTTTDTRLMGYSLPKVRSSWWFLGNIYCQRLWSLLTVFLVLFASFVLRELLSSKTWNPCCTRRDSGSSLMNSTLRTSWTTRESLWSRKPSCRSLQVEDPEPEASFLTCVLNRAWLTVSKYSRSSYVPRRGSGSYGTLPHHCDFAEEVQVHLARGRRPAGLRASLRVHSVSKTLSDESPTQGRTIEPQCHWGNNEDFSVKHVMDYAKYAVPYIVLCVCVYCPGSILFLFKRPVWKNGLVICIPLRPTSCYPSDRTTICREIN